MQVFQDRYRDEVSRNKLALAGYWFSTLVDLVVTALKEHGESFGKDRRLMNNLRRDAIALVGTIVIIAVALFFHRWIVVSGSGGVSPIFFFGFALDAIVTTGILGNLIVFLLVKATKWDSLRIALWTFLIVHATLLTIIAIIGPRIGPFSIGPPLIGYLVSFVFWFGLHWAWRSMRPEVVSS
ncbi:MAG TPA: hypothetical protein VF074_12100 [Pyrinomonadaceae bacterium]